MRDPAGARPVRLPWEHLPVADGRGGDAAHVEAAGLAALTDLDSAGTGPWHLGEPPDGRARAEADRRGCRRRAGADPFLALE